MLKMEYDKEHYPALNLPPASLSVRRDGDFLEVMDRWRQRWVALTPEEWVRQHFASWLCGELGYPASRTANEVALTLFRTRRRADTVVYDDEGRPYMIVEYKRPSVKITPKVFDQIVRYNIVLRARYIVVSNGLNHYCCEITDHESGRYRFLSEIPKYS